MSRDGHTHRPPNEGQWIEPYCVTTLKPKPLSVNPNCNPDGGRTHVTETVERLEDQKIEIFTLTESTTTDYTSMSPQYQTDRKGRRVRQAEGDQ